ncbi:MAG TPA: hypothetical protein VKP03_01335 [Patescibacteria group bacterium]|nr:hypothetical protein [Patescibacteria group bacterium]
MKKTGLSLIIFVLLFNLWLPSSALALSFDNAYIVSDSALTDYQSMSLEQVRSFLMKKNSALADYRVSIEPGKVKSAAEIIWDSAQKYRVNPKFLLVMLQKEQSLIEDPSPTQKQLDWAMGYGVCDSCDPDDTSLIIFKGFARQVDRAAWRQRWYIKNSDLSWLRQKGQTYNIDGHNIKIVNQATANLYNYTPHIYGNYLFWKIWNKWFEQKYPNGSLLQAKGQAGVWLIENGQKRPFYNKGALLSRYDINDIVLVEHRELDKYEPGPPIKFANFSLLQTELGDVYLLVNDTLRRFESDKVWRTLGFNPEEFEELNASDFNHYKTGALITLKEAYPAGALLQNNKTGGVYFVQNGQKKPILSRDIIKLDYSAYSLTQVSPEELENFTTKEPARLKDGHLVKTADSPIVYVISEGKKRPIATADVFENLGYQWQNIQTVETKTLENIKKGPYLDLEFKKH